jgi:hypothetical protein
MTPIAITAHLYNGFVSADHWSPSIDGILGYWHMRARLGADEFNLTQGHSYQMTPVDGLPLLVVRSDELWWYACSSPLYGIAANVRKHIHRRFDQQAAERYLPDVRKVQTKAGAYKNARISLMHRITARVTWHVIGDRPEIDRLLSHCTAIGAKLGAGFGRVARWELTEGDPEIARHHRPLPIAYAEAHAITGPVMHWGIRPPARIPQNCTDCVMPAAPEKMLQTH